jgi:hypothetical protein
VVAATAALVLALSLLTLLALRGLALAAAAARRVLRRRLGVEEAMATATTMTTV